jgi:hypothetical protein
MAAAQFEGNNRAGVVPDIGIGGASHLGRAAAGALEPDVRQTASGMRAQHLGARPPFERGGPVAVAGHAHLGAVELVDRHEQVLLVRKAVHALVVRHFQSRRVAGPQAAGRSLER